MNVTHCPEFLLEFFFLLKGIFLDFPIGYEEKHAKENVRNVNQCEPGWAFSQQTALVNHSLACRLSKKNKMKMEERRNSLYIRSRRLRDYGIWYLNRKKKENRFLFERTLLKMLCYLGLQQIKAVTTDGFSRNCDLFEEQGVFSWADSK